jgi:hypothetical protein
MYQRVNGWINGMRTRVLKRVDASTIECNYHIMSPVPVTLKPSVELIIIPCVIFGHVCPR